MEYKTLLAYFIPVSDCQTTPALTANSTCSYNDSRGVLVYFFLVWQLLFFQFLYKHECDTLLFTYCVRCCSSENCAGQNYSNIKWAITLCVNSTAQ